MVSNVATSTLPRPGAAALLAAAAIAYPTVGISPAHANDFSNCRLKKEAARCRGTRSASPWSIGAIRFSHGNGSL